MAGDAAGWECAGALLRFYRALDAWDAEALAREVCADAVWVRHGRRIEGGAAIRDALSGPLRERLVRHVLTNVVVEADGADAARGTAIMLTYGAARPSAGGSPGSGLPGEVAVLHAPGGLFDNVSHFRREGGV